MRTLTEQDLLARCALGRGVELHLLPDEILAPSALELVRMRNIRVLVVSGDGQVVMDGTPVHPLSTKQPPVRRPDKAEVQTHLNGTELVSKAHPRIWFRGKVDSALAATILVQTELGSIWSSELSGLLGDLRSWLGWVMRCEVLEERVPDLSLGLFSMDALVRLSLHPEELGLEPLWPDSKNGFVVARLSWLRAVVRETEVAAVFTFGSLAGVCQRPDLLRLLDGAGSALYVLMLLAQAGDKGLQRIRLVRAGEL